MNVLACRRKRIEYEDIRNSKIQFLTELIIFILFLFRTLLFNGSTIRFYLLMGKILRS